MRWPSFLSDAGLHFIQTGKESQHPSHCSGPHSIQPSFAGIETEAFHKFGYQIVYVYGKKEDKLGQLDHSNICQNSNP
jgi:hypothetical protein